MSYLYIYIPKYGSIWRPRALFSFNGEYCRVEPQLQFCIVGMYLVTPLTRVWLGSALASYFQVFGVYLITQLYGILLFDRY